MVMKRRVNKQPEWLKSTFMMLLVTIMGISYLDSSIISTLITSIKKDLDVNNFDVGMATSCNLAGSLLFGVIFANFTRRFHRWTLIVFGMVIWTGGVLLCYLSDSYIMLIFGRFITGVGQAPNSVLEPPLLNDVAPYTRKAIWIGINNVSQGIGSSIGPFYASRVSKATGHWQDAFLVELIIIGSLLLIGIFPPFYKKFKACSLISNRSMTASIAQPHASFGAAIAHNAEEYSQGTDQEEEDQDGDSEADGSEMGERVSNQDPLSESYLSQGPRNIAVSERPPFLTELRNLSRNPVFVLFVVGMASSFFCFAAQGYFMNAYLQEIYGMSNSSASNIITITGFASSFIATPAGALWYDYMVKKKQPITRQYRCQMACKLLFLSYLSSGAVAIPCSIIKGKWIFIIGIGTASSLLSATAAINTLACINAVPEHSVDMAMAINGAFTSILGQVPAPSVAGALADAVGYYKTVIICFMPMIIAIISSTFTWICSCAPGYPFKTQFNVWLGRESLENLKARDVIAEQGQETEKLLDNQSRNEPSF